MDQEVLAAYATLKKPHWKMANPDKNQPLTAVSTETIPKPVEDSK